MSIYQSLKKKGISMRKGSVLNAAMLLVVIVAAVVLCALFSGCVEQFWPASQVSPTTVNYIGDNPSNYQLPITTLGNVRRVQTKIEETHIEKQLRLKAEMDQDTGIHALAKSEAAIIAASAKSQYDTIIGSIDSPGILASLLSIAIGGGGMTAVLRRIWYTEDEYQKGVARASENQTV